MVGINYQYVRPPRTKNPSKARTKTASATNQSACRVKPKPNSKASSKRTSSTASMCGFPPC